MHLKLTRRYAAAGIAAVVVVAVAVAGGVAVAGNGDDEPLTGATYDQAVVAALAHTGGGAVTETEIGDGNAAYEVEIRLPDGSQVEVELDAEFNVLGSSPDDDGAGDDDDDGDDGDDGDEDDD